LNLYWTCPICGSKVDFTEQLTGICFDEQDGEANFDVNENGGIIFHNIFCPRCNASWVMSIGGMNKSELKTQYK